MKTTITRLFSVVIFVAGIITLSNRQSVQRRVLAGESGPTVSCDVWLVSKADSTVLKTAIADDSGIFKLEQLTIGNYILRVSFIDFKPYHENVKITGAIDIGIIQLQPKTNRLTEVKVRALKPLLERQSGKLRNECRKPDPGGGKFGLGSARRTGPS